VSPNGGPDPVLIGLLFDFPQPDGGEHVEDAVRLGLEEMTAGGRFDRPVQFVRRATRGLPAGTAHDVEQGFAALVDAGVLAVAGPSISDNALIVRDLADRARLPVINYSGGAMTRSQFMFHYQVGSLEEEPLVLARHLLDAGARRVGVAFDLSPVGRGYLEWFEQAAGRDGLEVAAAAGISPLAEDGSAVVARLRSAGPDAVVYLGLGMAARTVAVALQASGWSPPVVANSALMFGYARKDWRAGWEGWVYLDTVSDANTTRQRLKERSAATAAGPIGVAAYDIGRLLGEALVQARHLTRRGVTDGLERVKRLAAASGVEGTAMGFGPWDRGALKGEFLVRRTWRDGRTVEL
jgi:ABC-type branched-subunit amino acid transport system substrate-binding protein